MRRIVIMCLVSLMAVLLFTLIASLSHTEAQAEPISITQGELVSLDAEGKPAGFCPLRHTDVKAEISGFICRVTVTQQFHNPFDHSIEAVYTFPLSQNAAVDDMKMRIGRRVISGKIMRREEAREVYEQARAKGKTASLLDQERPNIFTQRVANIPPGEQIEVAISYVEMLRYEDGSYQFVFPMVVGPRYIPGSPAGKRGEGRAPDTTQVPDASLITPPVARMRNGHDISIEVLLNAGVTIKGLRSTLHEIESRMTSERAAVIKLKGNTAVPNKDFILNYETAGGEIEDAVLAHNSGGDGFFALILQPPRRVEAQETTPKELVFVLDTSGSMSGFPIEKAKEAMGYALEGLHPQDTFNLITFAGDTRILFPDPVAAAAENLALAREFLDSSEDGGGTEMMKAIRAALAPSGSRQHIRIVCFMTDGYVGNDMEIIAEVRKHPEARVFSFGIGDGVNRFLLDRMAEEGRGEVEYVTLKDDGSAAARRFHERIRSPLLTDISIDWNELEVSDICPMRIPDVFSARPVVVCGRYKSGAQGTITLRGRRAGRDFAREVSVSLPEEADAHNSLPSLWARARVDQLMRQDYAGIQSGDPSSEMKEAITQLALDYRLMTQFTSFVAVEETASTGDGNPRRVVVPLYMPEGVSPEGVFGGSPTEDFSLWGMIQQHNWLDAVVPLALFILALCGLATALNCLMTYASARRQTRLFEPKIAEVHQVEDAIALARQHKKSPLAAVLGEALKKVQCGSGETIFEQAEEARRQSLAKQTARLKGLLRVLKVAGFLALAWGVIGAAIEIRRAYVVWASVSLIDDFVVEAWPCLVIAVAAFLAHRHFSSKINSISLDADRRSSELLANFLKNQGVAISRLNQG